MRDQDSKPFYSCQSLLCLPSVCPLPSSHNSHIPMTCSARPASSLERRQLNNDKLLHKIRCVRAQHCPQQPPARGVQNTVSADVGTCPGYRSTLWEYSFILYSPMGACLGPYISPLTHTLDVSSTHQGRQRKYDDGKRFPSQCCYPHSGPQLH